MIELLTSFSAFHVEDPLLVLIDLTTLTLAWRSVCLPHGLFTVLHEMSHFANVKHLLQLFDPIVVFNLFLFGQSLLVLLTEVFGEDLQVLFGFAPLALLLLDLT